jgi:putative ABC transport system ATP-binding protein
LVKNGKTILMVTHDNDLARRVTRTITLADGQIVSQVMNGKSEPEVTHG